MPTERLWSLGLLHLQRPVIASRFESASCQQVCDLSRVGST